MNERLLIVEDEETLCESLKRVLGREGYSVDSVSSAESAIEVCERGSHDLIITDIILPGITGIELLKKIKQKCPEQIIIIMTAYASLETAVEALRTGAYDYVVKPIMHEEIKQIVKNALRQGALQLENRRLRRQIEKEYDLRRIIGKSPAMKEILHEIKEIADAGDNVLLTGEVGTGRELIARAIHLQSARAVNPFVLIRGPDISEDIMGSPPLGDGGSAGAGAPEHEKGIFTEADGGIVFLREIANLDAGLQSKLLKTLEDQEARPPGADAGMSVGLRCIAATSKDIELAVRQGTFSDGLFKKINGTVVKLPPLRERKEDIEPLVDHFIQKYSHELDKDIKGIDREALRLLERYHWPGNVRELKNIIERAILISEDTLVRVKHLPQFFPPH